MSNTGARQPVCENSVEGEEGCKECWEILAWQAVLSPTPRGLCLSSRPLVCPHPPCSLGHSLLLAASFASLLGVEVGRAKKDAKKDRLQGPAAKVAVKEEPLSNPPKGLRCRGVDHGCT